jgi:hypothetical protein
MEMMNRAIEGAADFGDFMKKLQQANERAIDDIQQLRERDPATNEQEDSDGDRQPGENREMHRARLKRERRNAKKVGA